MNLVLWISEGELHTPQTLAQPLSVCTGGALTWSAGRTADPAAWLVPLEAGQGAPCCLLVADEMSYELSLNGRPLPPGVYPLQHGDEIAVEGRKCWVARPASVEFTTYDPRLHGENVFCFATKARLNPGQAIAICPGTDGNQCGVIYGKKAWEIASQRSASRCPSCGFDPNASEWRPPVRKSNPLLPRLMAMVARRN